MLLLFITGKIVLEPCCCGGTLVNTPVSLGVEPQQFELLLLVVTTQPELSQTRRYWLQTVGGAGGGGAFDYAVIE